MYPWVHLSMLMAEHRWMKMHKKPLSSLVLLPIFATSLLRAEVAEGGFLLGISLANIWSSVLGNETSCKIGPSAGAYAIMDLNLPIDLRIEGVYSEKGYQLITPIIYTDETGDRGSYTRESMYTTHYISVNTLGVIPISDRISTHLGLTFSYFIKGDWKRDVVDQEGPVSESFIWEMNQFEGQGELTSEDVLRSDVGLVLGSSFKRRTISLEMRLGLGLRQVYRDFSGRNTSAQFLMVYRFGK